jgi:hypothetical protein
MSGVSMKDRFRWQFDTATPPRVSCAYNRTESPFLEIPIACSVSDMWGVLSVTLSYKGAQDENYTQIDMDLVSGSNIDGLWVGPIPARTEVGFVNFFVVAESGIGARGRYPIYGDGVVDIDDATPPQLQHDVVDSASPGTTINVTAEAFDDVGIESVVLYVKPIGGTAFVTHIMQAVDQTDVYYFLLELPDREGVVEYYVQVTDVGGNVATSPSLNPQTEPHSFEVGGAAVQDLSIWIGAAVVLSIAVVAFAFLLVRSRRAKD